MAQHLIRSQNGNDGYAAYCGHRQQSNYNLTTLPEAYDLCSKCSPRYYTEQVKNSAYRLGDRLDLSRDGRRYSYKSIYEIRDADKVVVGFITIKNGFGMPWRVHAWKGGVSITQVERNEYPSRSWAMRR